MICSPCYLGEHTVLRNWETMLGFEKGRIFPPRNA